MDWSWRLGLLAALLGVASGQRNPRELLQASKPFLEIHWESYLTFPNPGYGWYPDGTHLPRSCEPVDDWTDHTAYGWDLSTVPINEGTATGANVVDIAFGSTGKCAWGTSSSSYNCTPLVCGLHLYQTNNEDLERIADLRLDIAQLQSRGALVKMSFDGQEYSNTRTGYNLKAVMNQADRIADAVEELNLDGIDLAQHYGCGSTYYQCPEQVSEQLLLLGALRRLMPDKIISYTFPDGLYENKECPLHFPFFQVVEGGHQHVDYVTLFRATEEGVSALLDLGVPKEKIVLGFSIGCGGDNHWMGDDLPDVLKLTHIAKDEGYAGVVLWSINRDTNHRILLPECDKLQSGRPDGTFTHAVSEILIA